MYIDKNNHNLYGYVYFIENNEKVGHVLIDSSKETIEIWNFAIYEQFRNRKLAEPALKEIIEWWKGYKLWLFVLKNNTIAINLYTKCGFKIIEELEDRYFMTLN